MADNQQPATKQDLLNLKTELRAEFRADLKEGLVEVETKLLEAMRDMQTELLRGMEKFARGNYSRMHRLESSDVDLNDRINVLEERVLVLETRPPAK
jgi:hypothetical protein